MQLPIKAGDQVFIRGDKESGKSTLCMAFAGSQSLVVLDPKGTEEWINYARHFGMVISRDPADVRRHPRVLMLLDQLSLDDRGGWRRPGTDGWKWTQTLENIWTRTNTIVVFEEAIQTLPSTGANSRARRILTQGRVPRLTSFITIQVTNWVDTLGPRLAGHYISFACHDDQELANIKSARGADPSVLKTLAPHAFAYHARGAQEWIVCPPLPIELVNSLTKISRVKKGVDAPHAEIAEPHQNGHNSALARSTQGGAESRQ